VAPHLIAPRLENAVVRLEPLAAAHVEGLRAAAAGERGSYRFTTVPEPEPESVEAYVAQELDQAATGSFAPLVQIDGASGTVVGHTSFMTPRWWPGTDALLAVEVGSTWLSAAAQGTAINTAAKLLLFTHAFEEWGVARVDLKTDARNARSRAGIVAVGAVFEGVLRGWQPSAAPGEEGRARDTAMHAVTAADWPAVKRALEARLAAKRDAGPSQA